MEVRSSFPIVYVDDVAASVRFYRDLVGFEVADVDGFVGELRQGGAIVLAQPADQVWGERVAYVEDPDGNPVHIRGPIAQMTS